jgi:hypothetical protein
MIWHRWCNGDPEQVLVFYLGSTPLLIEDPIRAMKVAEECDHQFIGIGGDNRKSSDPFAGGRLLPVLPNGGNAERCAVLPVHRHDAVAFIRVTIRKMIED